MIMTIAVSILGVCVGICLYQIYSLNEKYNILVEELMGRIYDLNKELNRIEHYSNTQ